MRAVAIATGSAKAVVGGAIDPQVGVINEMGNTECSVEEVGVTWYGLYRCRWVWLVIGCTV